MNRLRNKRVLVAGGAGFLGSHLCDALLLDDNCVVCVDNFRTGCADNLTHLEKESRFDFLEKDICEPFDCGAVDFVFDLASPASPADYLKWGVETLEVGSSGVRNCLNLAEKYKAGFLQASTSECYGDPSVHPQVEEYWGNVNPIGPRSVYDESKRFAEALTMAYRRYRGVNTHLVRIFNTYGPRLKVDDGRVISNFMAQALRGEDITVHGDGNQTRSFCYVSDEVEGILRLAASDEHMPINIGNPNEFTILECAQEVLRVTGAKSRIVHCPLPQDDPTQRRPDITKAQNLLGWSPKVMLKEGLELSLEWFKAAVALSMRTVRS